MLSGASIDCKSLNVGVVMSLRPWAKFSLRGAGCYSASVVDGSSGLVEAYKVPHFSSVRRLAAPCRGLFHSTDCFTIFSGLERRSVSAWGPGLVASEFLGDVS